MAYTVALPSQCAGSWQAHPQSSGSYFSLRSRQHLLPLHLEGQAWWSPSCPQTLTDPGVLKEGC